MSKCPLFLPYLPIPSPLSLQKVHELGSQCLAVSFQLEGQEGVSSQPASSHGHGQVFSKGL